MQALKSILRRQPRLALAYHTLRRALVADREKMVMTPYGFRIAGNTAAQSGSFEPGETAIISELLATHDRFVDCGANVGYYSCLARKVGRPILAVEPLPANLSLLLANLAANGWSDSEVVAAGLGRQVGIVEIFGTGTGASLLPGWATVPTNTLIRERVVMSTLDTLIVDRFPGERLLIKVDVEGTEFDLLNGGLRTLERKPSPTWIIEICLSENFPDGRNPRFLDTFDLLFSRGYEAFAAKAGQRPVKRDDVLRWLHAGQAEPGGYNYIFQRPATP